MILMRHPGIRKEILDTLTSKEADTVWASAFALLGGITIFNALKEGMPIAIVFILSGISLISLVPFFILRVCPKKTGNFLTLVVGFASFLSPMILIGCARISDVVYSNIYLCLVFYIPGIILFYTSLMYLGRYFGILPAFRGLATTGPYSVIRHPMYLGEILEFTGITLAYISILTVVCLSVIILLLVVRIILEERVLSESKAYQDYIIRTKYRLLPKIW